MGSNVAETKAVIKTMGSPTEGMPNQWKKE
jgi:hypothetical protein